MILSLIRLDLASAFGYNSFLFITGPLILTYLAASEVKYILYGSKHLGKWEIFVWIELFAALSFGVLRNFFAI